MALTLRSPEEVRARLTFVVTRIQGKRRLLAEPCILPPTCRWVVRSELATLVRLRKLLEWVLRTRASCPPYDTGWGRKPGRLPPRGKA